MGDHVQEWYACFVGGLDDEMLFELLLAGNYLDLTPLLELCAATVGLRTMSESVSFESRFAFDEQRRDLGTLYALQYRRTNKKIAYLLP